jgi:hypothetical protein
LAEGFTVCGAFAGPRGWSMQRQNGSGDVGFYRRNR